MSDYELIEKAILYIETTHENQPNLQNIADFVGLSEFHFQKLFTLWAGVSPKKFLQYVTLKHAKEALKESRNILDTAYEVGLSTPSRLYDLFITFEAVTPGNYKSLGDGLQIIYGINETPFGKVLAAITDKGLSDLSFITTSEEDYIQKLHKKWQKADLKEDNTKIEQFIKKIFYSDNGQPQLNVHLSGTNFQLKVWQALLKIPEGSLLSYKDISEYIKQPKASRAVGTAIGQNPIHYLIPCHRVLRQDGEIGGYAGGTARKRAILAKEKLIIIK